MTATPHFPGADGSSDELTEALLRQFVDDGYVRIDHAFPSAQAKAARAIFWNDLRAQGCLPDDPATWIHPVIRLGMYTEPSIVEAANSPTLHHAFDQLVGPGCWQPCMSVGTLPVRFPSAADPGDIGWHIDPAFDYHKPDFLDWRVNIRSRGRTLLMLLLFSDVEEVDAPTRIRTGSHADIARVLAPAGEAGLTLRELLPHFQATAARREVLATGAAGTAYLCHPFLVHSAQMHQGRSPRFMAQPPLLPRMDRWITDLDRPLNAVARAIHLALEGNR
jgi:hypothetical protein